MGRLGNTCGPRHSSDLVCERLVPVAPTLCASWPFPSGSRYPASISCLSADHYQKDRTSQPPVTAGRPSFSTTPAPVG